MPSRHRSRQRALQILFLWDFRRQPVEEAINAYYDTLYSEEHPERDAFVADLVRGAVEHVSELDEQIAKHAEHWRMERMPAVDRNVLRLAVYEMKYVGTPAAVAIDEGLELARKFSGEESVQFVNGVLDAIRREMNPGAAEGPASEGPASPVSPTEE
jgi:N utilization substance protein B